VKVDKEREDSLGGNALFQGVGKGGQVQLSACTVGGIEPEGKGQ